jgi:hypothetical protein
MEQICWVNCRSDRATPAVKRFITRVCAHEPRPHLADGLFCARSSRALAREFETCVGDEGKPLTGILEQSQHIGIGHDLLRRAAFRLCIRRPECRESPTKR